MWAYDLKRWRIYQASSQDKRPFNFAVWNNLYIVNLRDRRATDVETWFGDAEGALSKFVDGLDAEANRRMTPEEAIPLLYGIVALNYRSGYLMSRMEQELRADPTIAERAGLSWSSDEEARRLIVQNCINVIRFHAESLMPPRFEIVRRFPVTLLLCDQPTRDGSEHPTQGEVYLPLEPNTMLCVRRDRAPNVAIVEATPDAEALGNSFNSYVVDRARRWIVASSQEELVQIQRELTPERLAGNIAGDTVSVTPTRLGQDWLVLKE